MPTLAKPQTPRPDAELTPASADISGNLENIILKITERAQDQLQNREDWRPIRESLQDLQQAAARTDDLQSVIQAQVQLAKCLELLLQIDDLNLIPDLSVHLRHLNRFLKGTYSSQNIIPPAQLNLCASLEGLYGSDIARYVLYQSILVKDMEGSFRRQHGTFFGNMIKIALHGHTEEPVVISYQDRLQLIPIICKDSQISRKQAILRHSLDLLEHGKGKFAPIDAVHWAKIIAALQCDNHRAAIMEWAVFVHDQVAQKAEMSTASDPAVLDQAIAKQSFAAQLSELSKQRINAGQLGEELTEMVRAAFPEITVPQLTLIPAKKTRSESVTPLSEVANKNDTGAPSSTEPIHAADKSRQAQIRDKSLKLLALAAKRMEPLSRLRTESIGEDISKVLAPFQKLPRDRTLDLAAFSSLERLHDYLSAVEPDAFGKHLGQISKIVQRLDSPQSAVAFFNDCLALEVINGPEKISGLKLTEFVLSLKQARNLEQVEKLALLNSVASELPKDDPYGGLTRIFTLTNFAAGDGAGVRLYSHWQKILNKEPPETRHEVVSWLVELYSRAYGGSLPPHAVSPADAAFRICLRLELTASGETLDRSKLIEAANAVFHKDFVPQAIPANSNFGKATEATQEHSNASVPLASEPPSLSAVLGDIGSSFPEALDRHQNQLDRALKDIENLSKALSRQANGKEPSKDYTKTLATILKPLADRSMEDRNIDNVSDILECLCIYIRQARSNSNKGNTGSFDAIDALSVLHERHGDSGLYEVYDRFFRRNLHHKFQLPQLTAPGTLQEAVTKALDHPWAQELAVWERLSILAQISEWNCHNISPTAWSSFLLTRLGGPEFGREIFESWNQCLLSKLKLPEREIMIPWIIELHRLAAEQGMTPREQWSKTNAINDKLSKISGTPSLHQGMEAAASQFPQLGLQPSTKIAFPRFSPEQDKVFREWSKGFLSVSKDYAMSRVDAHACIKDVEDQLRVALALPHGPENFENLAKTLKVWTSAAGFVLGKPNDPPSIAKLLSVLRTTPADKISSTLRELAACHPGSSTLSKLDELQSALKADQEPKTVPQNKSESLQKVEALLEEIIAVFAEKRPGDRDTVLAEVRRSCKLIGLTASQLPYAPQAMGGISAEKADRALTDLAKILNAIKDPRVVGGIIAVHDGILETFTRNLASKGKNSERAVFLGHLSGILDLLPDTEHGVFLERYITFEESLLKTPVGFSKAIAYAVSARLDLEITLEDRLDFLDKAISRVGFISEKQLFQSFDNLLKLTHEFNGALDPFDCTCLWTDIVCPTANSQNFVDLVAWATAFHADCKRQGLNVEQNQLLLKQIAKKSGRGIWLDQIPSTIRALEPSDFTKIVPIQGASSRKPSELRSTGTRKSDLYRQLFERMEVPLETAFLALVALSGRDETTVKKKSFHNFRDLVRRTHVPNQKGGTEQPADIDLKPVETFCEFIALHQDKHQPRDLNALGISRYTELLRQLCYRGYDGDYGRMSEELEQYLTRAEPGSAGRSVAETILKTVVPRLAKRFQTVEQFASPESIRFEPWAHQREAVVCARHEERPILIMGPGTGKTETGAMYCESLKSSELLKNGFLWCTQPSVMDDTVRRLRTEILAPSSTVIEIRGGELAENISRLRMVLETADYLVTTYDSMHSWRKFHPEAYRILQEWTASRTKVLDEAHTVDNPTGKWSLAVQNLNSSSTLVMSATPFQHRPERTATLLHLALPEFYPDPIRLAEDFKANPGYCRAELHSRAYVCGISDVAKTFEPFSEIPAAKQLEGGIPRVPNLKIHRHRYQLSAEHTNLYVDLALKYPELAAVRGYAPRRQFHYLRQLTINPEKLDASPAHSLVASVREIAIPALQRGEKVLIFGQHLHLIRMIHEDPELRRQGIELIEGKVDPKVRTKLVQDLERGNSSCLVAQLRCGSTGLNYRSTSHIIFLERPKTTAETVQAMHRHVRMLGRNDLDFALKNPDGDSHVWFLEPELDPEIIKEIDDPGLNRYLSRGNVYAAQLDRELGDIEDYLDFVAPVSRKTEAENQDRDIRGMIERLAQVYEEHETGRKNLTLMSERGIAEHFWRYRTNEKKAWRSEGIERFLNRNLSALGIPVDQARCAVLSGPDAGELPSWLKFLKPGNIDGFEADPNPEVREFSRSIHRRLGCRFFDSRIEEVLPFAPAPYDAVSLDTQGYLPGPMCRMLIDLPMKNQGLILLNRLCQRESGESAEHLALFNGERRELDLELIKLSGTNLRVNGAEPNSVTETLRHSIAINAVSQRLAKICKEVAGGEFAVWSDLLSDLAKGSHFIRALEQFEYKTPKGRPFLSTFARLERWEGEWTNSPVTRTLRAFISERACGLREGRKGHASMFDKLGINSRDLSALYDYYAEQVEGSLQREAFLAKPLVKLKV